MSANTHSAADGRTISELQRLSSVARDTAQITAEVPAWLQSELVTMADAMADAAGEIARLQALADSGGRTISEPNIPEAAVTAALDALAYPGYRNPSFQRMIRDALLAAAPHMAPLPAAPQPSPSADSVARDAPIKPETVGPREKVLRKMVCDGCPKLVTKYWRDALENDETDIGTMATCEAAGRTITAYWQPGDSPPTWCPAMANAPEAQEGEPR